MLEFKSFAAFAGVAALAALALGTGSAQANVIDFGAQPIPSGCTLAAGDSGLVCPNMQTFAANGGAFVTIGWAGAVGNPTANPTFLTFKPESPNGPPSNSFQESGLGENGTGPGNPCDDSSSATDCEIAGTAAAGARSTNGAVIDDVVIGSVQTGENWILWTGSDFQHLTQFATGVGGSCTPFNSIADTCAVSGFQAGAVVVQSGGSGDVLLVEASFTPAISTPEPGSVALFGTALAGLGWLRRRRRLAATV